MQCINCFYWLETEPPNEDLGDEGVGICRRYPPASVLDGEDDSSLTDEQGNWCGRPCHNFIYWAQPRTLGDEWCGEWKETK